MTSRRRPAQLDGRVRAEAVHALSRDEAVLLARELPNLGALIAGPPLGRPGQDAAGQVAARRELAARVLAAAQGHPKLLELADGQAADPDRLEKLLGTADQEWARRGVAPDGLFTSASGEPAADAEDYAAVLDEWTRQVADGLTPAARAMFGLLCCLEEEDRSLAVIDGNWADLWQRLGLPGALPDQARALEPLTSQGLIAVVNDADGDLTGFRIHPGVAAAGRAKAGQEFQGAVDLEVAAYWNTAFQHAWEQETGPLIVRAGRAAVPYLLRLGEHELALVLLEQVLHRDRSPGTVLALLPVLRQIADAAHGRDDEIGAGLLVARALQDINRDAAERQLRGLLTTEVDNARYRSASVILNDLINNYLPAGRLTEALTLASQMADYTRRAGLGPWTQLRDERVRLQILGQQGQADRVLAEVTRLRQEMAELPEQSSQPETALVYNVRETILDTGRSAALQLRDWEDALTLNAEILESQKGRGASALEIARQQFNDYAPLLHLKRIAEARALLLECREINEREHNIQGLGKDLGALAAVENQAGHGQDAIDLQRNGLRYEYLVGEVETIATSHHNLGNYLARHLADYPHALAHHVASALLRALTGIQGAGRSLAAAAGELARLPDGTSAPASISELCSVVEEVPGVRLDRLLSQLTDDSALAPDVLGTLLAQARVLADPNFRFAGHLAAWDPVIAGLAAARGGDDQARAAVEQHLTERQDSADWGKLAAVLRGFLDADTVADLPDDLDEIDIAIARRALAGLSGDVPIPDQLWQALPLTGLIDVMVAATHGDLDAIREATDILTGLDTHTETAALAHAMRRILDGDRAADLADGLDPVAASVVAAIVAHLPPPAPAEQAPYGSVP